MGSCGSGERVSRSRRVASRHIASSPNYAQSSQKLHTLLPYIPYIPHYTSITKTRKKDKMPHAISPASSPPVADDTIMSEAVPEAAEDDSNAVQKSDGVAETDEVEAEVEGVQTEGDATNLEDMFDDDDDDDEFASSAPVKAEEEMSQEAQPYAVKTISPIQFV